MRVRRKNISLINRSISYILYWKSFNYDVRYFNGQPGVVIEPYKSLNNDASVESLSLENTLMNITKNHLDDFLWKLEYYDMNLSGSKSLN